MAVRQLNKLESWPGLDLILVLLLAYHVGRAFSTSFVDQIFPPFALQDGSSFQLTSTGPWVLVDTTRMCQLPCSERSSASRQSLVRKSRIIGRRPNGAIAAIERESSGARGHLEGLCKHHRPFVSPVISPVMPGKPVEQISSASVLALLRVQLVRSIIRQRDQRSLHLNLVRKILRSLSLFLDSTLGRCSKALGQNTQGVKGSTLIRAERDRCKQRMSLDCWSQQQAKMIRMSGYCSPESQ
jgi:hypothetical protein